MAEAKTDIAELTRQMVKDYIEATGAKPSPAEYVELIASVKAELERKSRPATKTVPAIKTVRQQRGVEPEEELEEQQAERFDPSNLQFREIKESFAKGALKEEGVEYWPQRDALKEGPMVDREKSVTDNYLLCLEDGQKMKILRRHLRTYYGMTPEEYRDKWGLPADYPIVAPAYVRLRKRMARKQAAQDEARKQA